MVEKNEMHSNVQYSICDLHFGIIKSELLWGFLSEFFKFLAINYSSSIWLGIRFCSLPINLFTGSFNYCQSEYEAVSVNFYQFLLLAISYQQK